MHKKQEEIASISALVRVSYLQCFTDSLNSHFQLIY